MKLEDLENVVGRFLKSPLRTVALLILLLSLVLGKTFLTTYVGEKAKQQAKVQVVSGLQSDKLGRKSPTIMEGRSQNPHVDPLVYIHILSKDAHEKARRLEVVLEKEGFGVMRIIQHDTGPQADQVIYWQKSDEWEAASVARLANQLVLGEVKIVYKPLHEAEDSIQRHYELWVPSLSAE